MLTKEIPSGKFQGRKITEYGDVLGTSGCYLKKMKASSGLFFIQIKNVREYIHVLVARTFVPSKNEFPHVLHIDGDVTNNHKDNLKWSKHPEMNNFKYVNIPGFSNYKISKDGKIKSYFNRQLPRKIRSQLSEKGYLFVNLKSDTGEMKGLRVSRLVALTYIPNPQNFPEVDHIDRNRTNNNVTNLRWADRVTQANNRNMVNCFKKRLERYSLDKEFIDVFNSAKDAVEKLKLTVKPNALTKNAIKNKTELKAVTKGFYWKYENSDDQYILREGEKKSVIIGTFGSIELDYPNYFITNFGVLLNEKGMAIKSDGHCPSYKLHTNGKQKTFQAHVLVALFFVKGRTTTKCIVDHLDGDRTNSRFDNLEWVTSSENSQRAAYTRHKSVSKIDPITGKILEIFESEVAAGKSIGKMDGKQISACIRGSVKTVHGFIWKFSV